MSIYCIENILKQNTEGYILTMISLYGVNLQIHRFEQGSVETFYFDTIADVAGSLSGKYFYVYSPDSSYCIWINVDYKSIAPIIGDKRLVVVNIKSGDSANTIAALVATAIKSTSDFLTSVTNNRVTVTNRTTGNATNPTAQTSGFTNFTVTTVGVNPDEGSEYLEVYGKRSAPVTKVSYISIKGMVIGDKDIPIDPHSAGTFDEGYLWVASTANVKTGDTMVVERNDGRVRRYTITEPHGLGTTNAVTKKWLLAAIAD
jgi:hypothetical protein